MCGVDLAWGGSRPDGFCPAILGADGRAEVGVPVLLSGDAALDATLEGLAEKEERVFCAVDAPLVCPNAEGSRPVDRQMHAHFGRQHAGCHPANRRLVTRAWQWAERLAAAGWRLGWEIPAQGERIAAEVYPHAAMVRWFGLERIYKYKRGRVEERTAAIQAAGRRFEIWLEHEAPWIDLSQEGKALLRLARWSKPDEDRFDALVCVFIGLWHVRYGGERSDLYGERKSGFLLVPQCRPGYNHHR